MPQLKRDEYYAPDHCQQGMCDQPISLAMIEVITPRGKRIIRTFGEVCEIDHNGNLTRYLMDGYEYIRWHGWCADCLIRRIDRCQNQNCEE